MASRRRSLSTDVRPEENEAFWRLQSPWIHSGKVPDADNPPFRRPLVAGLVRRLIEDVPHRFHLLVGARRIGKTTVVTQVIADLLASGVDRGSLLFVRMDHPLLVGGDRHPTLMANLKTFAEGRPGTWLFLDELTVLPRWDLWLKTMHDERWNVRVVATSSATAALRAGRDDSGVGRWEVHELGPWTLGEFAAVQSDAAELPAFLPAESDDLADTLASPSRSTQRLTALMGLLGHVGGFPEYSNEPFDLRVYRTQRRLKDDAVDRVVYKDIPQSFPISNPAVLEKLLYVLAGQVCQVLSPQSLAQVLGVSQPTVDQYLSYLVHSHLVFTTTNWSPTEEARQRRGRKLYFRDPAVRNAALLRGLDTLSSEEWGLLYENLAASHLQSLAAAANVRLAHWRDRSSEVDLIYDHPSRPMAFEVGSHKHARAGLRRLVERHPELRGRAWVVLSETPWRSAQDDPEGIGTIDLPSFLWAVSRQIARSLHHRFG